MIPNQGMKNRELTETDNHLFTLQLPSKLESIIDLENFLEDLQVRLSIPEEAFANIQMCMNEAVINAIDHGNQLDPNKKVYINAEVQPHKKLIFNVKDEGPGFNFNQVADPTLPENLESLSGRGIYIIRQLADQVIFNTEGNEMELHFFL
jgi:serine/threonine-protein kinase RsbW